MDQIMKETTLVLIFVGVIAAVIIPAILLSQKRKRKTSAPTPVETPPLEHTEAIMDYTPIAENIIPLSEDEVKRKEENTHRNQLLKPPGAVNFAHRLPTTTSELMMRSIDTRSNSQSRNRKESTATMDYIMGRSSHSSGTEQDPIPAGSIRI